MIRIESPPVQGIPAGPIRDMVALLLRNDAALSKADFATKDDIEALKRLISANATVQQRNSTTTIVKTSPPVVSPEPGDQLPVVSGAYDEIWTLSAVPPSAFATPASMVVENLSPGWGSPVDPVTGSGGDPLNFAQININGTYVYPAADMNLGFGGFLNFNTRNLAGEQIQGAFVNGGLIGTTDGAERGDLDLGIYGPPKSGAGDNEHRIVALRAESGGTLAFTVDQDESWDLGDSVGRWRNAYFSGLVQCGGLELRYNDSDDFVFAVANPSDMIDAGPFATLSGYYKTLLNSTPVYIPYYTA